MRLQKNDYVVCSREDILSQIAEAASNDLLAKLYSQVFPTRTVIVSGEPDGCIVRFKGLDYSNSKP